MTGEFILNSTVLLRNCGLAVFFLGVPVSWCASESLFNLTIFALVGRELDSRIGERSSIFTFFVLLNEKEGVFIKATGSREKAINCAVN